MDALPKSAQPATRAALAEIRGEDREYAEQVIAVFECAYGPFVGRGGSRSSLGRSSPSAPGRRMPFYPIWSLI